MPDLKDEARLREAIELLYFGYREFTAGPDRILAERGLNRVHHRILYFIGRHDPVSVSELLAILDVTKQALHGPLRKLVRMDLVSNEPAVRDRRVKHLRHTASGRRLEQRLTGTQMALLGGVFETVGDPAARGWRAVMDALKHGCTACSAATRRLTYPREPDSGRAGSTNETEQEQAMDFELPAELTSYLHELDEFIEAEIKPLEQADDNIRFFDHRREDARTDWDRGGLPSAQWEALLAEAVRRADAAGHSRYPAPKEYGGRNGTNLDMAVIREHFATKGLGLHNDLQNEHSIVGNNISLLLMLHYGSARQKTEWVDKLANGTAGFAFGITEPEHGSDATHMETRAVRDGDEWVLNGSKIYITNGVLADVLFIAAKTDLEAPGSRGVSIFIVERGTPGFTVANQLEKMGWRSSDTAELVFEDCRVPASNLLGEENRGFYAIMQNFQNERIALSAQAIGEAQKGLDLTHEYARDRKAFGKTLWDQPVIRNKLAMLQAKVSAARSFIYETAWRASQGEEVVRDVSMLKALCGDLVNEVMYACQQYHGGFGYMQGTPIERMVRDARVQAVGGGATEVMLEEVAKRMGPSNY